METQPTLTWMTAPPQPYLAAGDQVEFDVEGEKIVHTITEAEAEAEQFQGPFIPTGKTFTMRIRRCVDGLWS